MMQYFKLLRRETGSWSSESFAIIFLYIWYWMTIRLLQVECVRTISNSKIGGMMWDGLFWDRRCRYAHIACSLCAVFVLRILIPIRKIVSNFIRYIVLRFGIILFFDRRWKAGPDWNQGWRWIHFCIDCCFVRTMHYVRYVPYVIPLMAVWSLSILFYV